MRTRFHTVSATRNTTKPTRMACASNPTAQIEPSQANTKPASDKGNA